MTTTDASKVCAVMVTYHPALDRLNAGLNALRPQVGSVLIVDNGSLTATKEWLQAQTEQGRIHLIGLDSNIGVAAAVNRGIDWARERGFADVLLLDHDSVPAARMVERLLEARQNLERSGARVAAVGPECRDPKYPGGLPFYRLEGWRIARKTCAELEPGSTLRAECLITSGSLISLAVLDRIGAMDVELFVDYVDIEWGMRASSLGYFCFGVCGALLDHQLGDSIKPFFGVAVPMRSPLRQYYLFRNAILMFRRTYVPWRWKVNDAFRLLLKYGYYPIFASPRLEYLRMMTLGITHAIWNKSGRLILPLRGRDQLND